MGVVGQTDTSITIRLDIIQQGQVTYGQAMVMRYPVTATLPDQPTMILTTRVRLAQW